MKKILFLIFLFGLESFIIFSNTNISKFETSSKKIFNYQLFPLAVKQNNTSITTNSLLNQKSYDKGPDDITILATGDIMLGRNVNLSAVKKNDFTFLFDKTRDLLKSADVVFINLEGPLVTDCPIKTDGLIFCGDLRNIEGLKSSGITIANLANNHSTNFGQSGLEDTENTLRQNNIAYTGIQGPTYLTIKNTKIAFLGYNDIDFKSPLISRMEQDKVSSEISEAKRQSDIVVVEFHWGVEYTRQPTQRQINFAHLAIDSGADLVLGNHPHWVQPLEVYKNKVIVYSHGNFIFDQFWSQETREGIIGEYTFSNKKISNVQFIPIYIIPPGQPTIAEGEERQRIYSIFNEASTTLEKNQSSQ